VEALAEIRAAWKSAPGDREMALGVHRLLMFGQRFPEALEIKRQILSYWPPDRTIGFTLAQDNLIAKGETADLEQWLAAIPAEEQETPEIVDRRMEIAGETGNESELIDLIRRHGLTLWQIDSAGVLLFRGESELLRQQLEKMKPALDQMRKDLPQAARTWTLLARYHALGGNRSEALAAIDRARQLLPESGDAWNGPNYTIDLVEALLWLGEKDAAIAEITRLIRHPRGVHVWELERTVYWQPLRTDPRIQALIADPKNRGPLF
jgi:tetratricopeptide (TPR) repeat protein